MLNTRVIPCLLLQDQKLVKTVKFKNPDYIGDPINAVKIYNEKEVDELIFLDINATKEGREPPFEVIARIADECFMPFAYGGGITSITEMRSIFRIGVEKVAINNAAVENPSLIKEASDLFGSQSLIVAIDVKIKMFGGYEVVTKNGKNKTGMDPVVWAREVERLGAGEILLTAVDRDGTMDGYDTKLIKEVSASVNIPVIALGGAGNVQDFKEAVNAGASAVAAGSFVVYQGKNKGVLINFPTQQELKNCLSEKM